MKYSTGDVISKQKPLKKLNVSQLVNIDRSLIVSS